MQNISTPLVLLGVLVLIVLIFIVIENLQDNGNTGITFQTPCAIQFILDVPIANTTNVEKQSYLKFIPQVGKRYKPSELQLEMNAAAQAVEFPLRVDYTNGKMYFICTQSSPQKILITDREFVETDGPLAPGGVTYVGAQYGEARRFLNHLFMPLDFVISYLPYNITGSFFDATNFLGSERSLLNNDIGVDPIPNPPSVCSAAITGDYQFPIPFNAPPAGSRTGIYLEQTGPIAGNLENWDIVDLGEPPAQITTYTFVNLGRDQEFRAAISVVGFFDESTLFYQQNGDIIVTGSPQPHSFKVINNTNRYDKNNIDGDIIIYNDYKVATKNLDLLPQTLEYRSQIVSVTIKFYININSVQSVGSLIFPPSYPSDARLEIENGGTADGESSLSWSTFDYMYWKRVKKDITAYYDSDVFGSTGFPGTNFGGLPLDWTTCVLTSAELLDLIFPSSNGGTLQSRQTPNLRFFIGYLSNQLLADQNIAPIYEYSIEYNV